MSSCFDNLNEHMKLITKIKALAKSNRMFSVIFRIVLITFEFLLKVFVTLFEPLKNIALLLSGAFIALAYLHYSGYLNSIKDKIIPAQPTIVSYSCDDSSTSLGDLEYSMRVVVNVRNIGGSGNVVVEADGYQGTGRWTKSEMFHMNHQQTSKITLIFDEVSLFGGDARCSARTFAYSK
ncbi:hypothetical protein LEP1GSC035_0282 [Leptospira noguchii str. 2007001578]|nr:hypothetical protein LEP1GSC035_0282 [Leptospira noguchii str. 2007001578]